MTAARKITATEYDPASTKQGFVLQRLQEGATRKQIADEMGRSPSDIGTIISRLRQKERLPGIDLGYARSKEGRQYGSRERIGIYLESDAFEYFGRIAQKRRTKVASVIRMFCEIGAQAKLFDAVVDDGE